jgi:predicted Zn-dependent protease
MKTYRFALLRSTLLLITFAWALVVQPAWASRDARLPDLGGGGSSIVSPNEERELGTAWLRLYRAHVPTSTDPFIQAYLEQLLQRLSVHADLNHRDLELVVVNSPALNAFAVPGGIIGVNTGLFLHAQNEQQLSSVLAHELAHLSQRHYARGLERQKNAMLPNMAALLAGLVIAATAGGDAGMAAIAATQAGALDQQLRFSRQMEQEADRLGMGIMAKAGMDPYAMGDMFEAMLRSTRFSRRPPEFLMSHPVTESRISDARLRAERYPRREQQEMDLMFHLVRARIVLAHENNPQQAVRRFMDEMEGSVFPAEAARYGLVLALTKTHELERARETLQPLLESSPHNSAYITAAADIEAAEERFDKALPLLHSALERTPDSHPLNVRYAEMLMTAGRYGLGESVLEKHVKRRPGDPYLWYLLAETHGLAGHILQVHTARAEYFVLVGLFDKAEIQLKNALARVEESDTRKRAELNERLKEVRDLKEKNPLR